jgi:hypothetical protein
MRVMKFSVVGILCAFALSAADDWRDPSPHKSAIVEANGIHLHYLDWGGNGPAMVLITGLGNTAHVFDTLAPFWHTCIVQKPRLRKCG